MSDEARGVVVWGGLSTDRRDFALGQGWVVDGDYLVVCGATLEDGTVEKLAQFVRGAWTCVEWAT